MPLATVGIGGTTGDDDAGVGRIVLDLHGNRATFSALSYRYPLKILSPRIHEPAVAIAYLLTYGGGLVSGDCIRLSISVAPETCLLLFTQGSTKVFKHRSWKRSFKAVPNSHVIAEAETVQSFDAHIRKDGLLLLLPDPVTCFSDAAYNQIQTFHLEDGASLVLLDWITCGRMSRGEEWEFSKYYSLNELWLAGARVAKDALLLEKGQNGRSIKQRMAPYSCYASLFLVGPKVQHAIEELTKSYNQISVYQLSRPPDLLWSLSSFQGGCVIRVAGVETEGVKLWLRMRLDCLKEHIGPDVISKALI